MHTAHRGERSAAQHNTSAASQTPTHRGPLHAVPLASAAQLSSRPRKGPRHECDVLPGQKVSLCGWAALRQHGSAGGRCAGSFARLGANQRRGGAADWCADEWVSGGGALGWGGRRGPTALRYRYIHAHTRCGALQCGKVASQSVGRWLFRRVRSPGKRKRAGCVCECVCVCVCVCGL